MCIYTTLTSLKIFLQYTSASQDCLKQAATDSEDYHTGSLLYQNESLNNSASFKNNDSLVFPIAWS